MLRHATGKTVRAAAVYLAFAFLALDPSPSAAETAWVKDELRLNRRTGPGTEFRILGVMTSGDRVTIVDRKEGWTQVQPANGEPGWIPVGYLRPSPPASIQLTNAKTRVSTLEGELEQITTEVGGLRTTNQNLVTRDVEITAAMTELKRENQAYRAAAEWGGYIAGAGILASGMVVGWMLKASSGRNRASRIRL